jgi:hypothetical protein
VTAHGKLSDFVRYSPGAAAPCREERHVAGAEAPCCSASSVTNTSPEMMCTVSSTV